MKKRNTVRADDGGIAVESLSTSRAKNSRELLTVKVAKRILLVEDDENNLELTLKALKEYHLSGEVAVARDGKEALDYLYRRGKFKMRCVGNPALLLLDLRIPEVDGLGVLRQIKSDEQLKTIPVVVHTSSRQDRDLIESYKLGVNAYVVKPVDFRQFVEAVRQLSLFWLVFNEPPLDSTHQAEWPSDCEVVAP